MPAISAGSGATWFGTFMLPSARCMARGRGPRRRIGAGGSGRSVNPGGKGCIPGVGGCGQAFVDLPVDRHRRHLALPDRDPVVWIDAIRALGHASPFAAAKDYTVRRIG